MFKNLTSICSRSLHTSQNSVHSHVASCKKSILAGLNPKTPKRILNARISDLKKTKSRRQKRRRKTTTLTATLLVDNSSTQVSAAVQEGYRLFYLFEIRKSSPLYVQPRSDCSPAMCIPIGIDNNWCNESSSLEYLSTSQVDYMIWSINSDHPTITVHQEQQQQQQHYYYTSSCHLSFLTTHILPAPRTNCLKTNEEWFDLFYSIL